jgi:uncharacterized repeat protein (TIGR01451 family)
MSGRIASIAVVCLLGMHVAVPSFAQEQASEPARRPSLSERLQRFRTDVLGSPSDERPKPNLKNQPPAASASRKTMGSKRQPLIAPSGPQPAPQSVEAFEPVPQPMVSPSADMPQRMQLQSARRAQSGAGPVTVITPSNNAGAATSPATSIRRPVEVARRSALGEPTETAEVEEVVEGTAPESNGTSASEDAAVERTDSSDEATAEVVPAEEVAEESPAENSTGAEAVPTDTTRTNPERNKLRPVEPEPAVVEPTAVEPVATEPAAEVESPVAVAEEMSSNVLFTAQSPVLAVEASGPRTVMIGKEAEFLVKIKNSGTAANNVVVKIVIPSYADVASCRSSSGTAQPPSQTELNGGLEWTIERLEGNSEETLTLKLVPRKSSPLDLAINYTFTPETTQTMVEVQEPKLAMSLSGPSEVLFGQTKVFKLTISNPGNGDTHNVMVGLLPIGQSGEAQGTHKLGTLAAGESKTIDIELTARQAGALMIKAQSFADGGLRAEAAEEVRVRRAELKVAVEAPSVKYAGTPTTYQLTVENSGDALAENVQLSAVLPADAKFLSASGGRLDPQQARVSWNVGSLPAGGQRVFELQCALNTAGENHLQVAAQAGGDLSASATSSTQVEAIADLKLEIRDPQGPVAVGEEAVYEVRIQNRGTKDAQGVDLAVFFSEGLEAATVEGGPHDIGTGQVVFQPIASIAAGDAAVFHVRARAAQAGNHIFRAEVVCETLHTKLAAEEATHFYGDQRTAASVKREPTLAKREPTLAAPPESASEPQALEDTDAPPANPYE